mgnify:CR=1
MAGKIDKVNLHKRFLIKPDSSEHVGANLCACPEVKRMAGRTKNSSNLIAFQII